jgi:PAS domain-containing protein
MHKLTASEFANSVHDLLGGDAPLGPVEPDSIVASFSAIGASTVAMSPAGVGLYETATGTATDYVFSDATRAASVLACVPQTTSDAACITRALSAFGRRAFRRPLTDAEISRFSTLATAIGNGDGGSVLVGMRHAIWAILQSPSFLYRVELGTPSAADGGALKYTSWEMASRLAGALWNSVPDDALLDAASKDTLSDAAGVRAQATRMLAAPQAHRAVTAFTDDLYGLQLLGEATKDPTLFPTFTDAIRGDMQQELEQRVDDMVFTTKGDFLSLLDSKTTFVNQALAAYYGLPAVSGSGFQRVDFPSDSPRAGLLGAGAILVAYGLPQRNSPTARGKFVASAFLCTDVPPPPPNVPALPAMTDATATMRERMTVHRASPSCASCHAIMDPIGFGMEDFDSAGLHRTTDNGKPVDATGALDDGAPFNGLAQLGGALRKAPIVPACFVSKVYANALGRIAIDLDAPTVATLAKQFAASGNHADELLLNVISSDSFRFVLPGKG